MDCTIFTLTPSDLDRLTLLDAKLTGRRRKEWFSGRLASTDVQMSLGAQVDGSLVGALLGSVHYGEFGQPEPVAVLDTILVDPRFSGRGIAHHLLDQLMKNLAGLRVDRVRTELSWEEQDLLGFLAHEGFQPVPRLVLERAVEA